LALKCISAIEMPDYTIVEKISDDIEIRKYSALKWVCASSKNEGDSSMFLHLFEYISGQNEQKEKIPMTAPVLKQYNASNSLESMCFYLPKANQLNPPQPSGIYVYLHEQSEVTLATIRFGGFGFVSDSIKQKALLIEKLNERVANFETSKLITAGYDSPVYPIVGRRNEVFLVQK